ncbi:hypothetical protein Tco_1190770, partial [Tanacetum coccineum]
MDSMIPIGQKNTLAEYMILSGANNRPPMLDKDRYDSWKSRMEIYMQNREHGRMILESVEHGLLIWPTIEENGVARTKKYYGLVVKDLWERIQLLMQGTSLTKQERECKLYDAFDKFAHIKGESLHQYYLRFTQLINDMNIYNLKLEQFKSIPKACPQPPSVPQIEYIVSTINQQTHLAEFPQMDSGLAVLVFKQGDDPIDAINKMMSFLSTVITSRFPSTNNQLRNSSNPRQKATIHDGREHELILQEQEGIIQVNKGLLSVLTSKGKVLNEEELEFLADPSIAEGPVTQSVITHNEAYQADDLDACDSHCDEISTAKAIWMTNLSSYSSDVLSEVPYSHNTNNDMLNQSVQEMPYSKPSQLMEHPKDEIHSDSNIILYSQYLSEIQNAAVQDTNSPAQQDAMILFVFEQLSEQITNCNKVNKDNLMANETLYAELERYKERVKLLEERQNVDLSTREKL